MKADYHPFISGIPCFESDDAEIVFRLDSADEHTMGENLQRYVDGKIQIHDGLENLRRIEVVPAHKRVHGVSEKEKRDKLFNWQRPSLTINGDEARLHVFPGKDYVLHYRLLLETWFKLRFGRIPQITHSVPRKSMTWEALDLTGVKLASTVIIGYVEAIRNPAADWSEWDGNASFLSSIHCSGKVAVLGCRHSYWGDIAGVLLWKLACLGVDAVVYVGKLGALRTDLTPNESFVTGSSSIINGQLLDWSSVDICTTINAPKVRHVCLPSTILETLPWAVKARTVADVVDPEIGHLASVALQCGLRFGYLHMVTDRLLRQGKVGLFNERERSVQAMRTELLTRMVEQMYKLEIW